MGSDDGLEALERELTRLAQRMTYPEPSPLSAAIHHRLQVEARAQPRRWRLRLTSRLAAVVGAILVASALTMALSGAAREAVAGFLGLDRVKIFRLEEEPTGLRGELAGTPVALSEAEDALGQPLRLPTYPEGVGGPDEVLLQRFGGRIGVMLVYRQDGLAFSLLETAGSIGKGLAFGATVRPVSVGDAAGLWLEGQRVVVYLDEAGNPIEESRRAADANTLIWEDAGLVFRLEGGLSLAEAIRIAESIPRGQGR